MPTKWLAKRWEAFFFALNEMSSNVEIEALCKAEVEAWRSRKGMKQEISLQVPMSDTRNEIENRVQDEHKRELALKFMAFPHEWYEKQHAPSHEKHASRMENAQLITNPDAIVERATMLLASNDWPSLAIGITANTGRRLTEVLKTARFEQKTDFSVMFSGQLKRGKDMEDVAFEIPTLAPAELVIDALRRLREMVDTSNLEKRETSRRYGAAVREAANLHFTGLVPPREGDDLYTHLMRSVYARLAVWYYAPLRVSDIHFMATILGHRRLLELSSEAEQLNYASSAHYFDFKVVDETGAMRQGVWLGKKGVVLLEAFNPKPVRKEVKMTTTTDVQGQTTEQPQEQEPKRKSGFGMIKPTVETQDRFKALNARLGHRKHDETMVLLLDTYEQGGNEPVDLSKLMPEWLAPDLATIIRAGMEASGEENFVAFLHEALSKEAKFRMAMKSRHSDTDFSKLPTSQLALTRHPGATEERIRRAVAAIGRFNDQAAAMERWYINSTSVHKLVGGRFSMIGEYLEKHQEEVNALNTKYGLTPAYNRKPVLIDTVITVPEEPEV